MKLRLLLFPDCNRRCKGCCNKEWDLSALPTPETFKGYSEVILTGGEPMLRPEIIKQTISEVRKQTDVPIYLYTAMSTNQEAFLEVLELLNGVCLTLHTQRDVEPFIALNKLVSQKNFEGKSLRLNVFNRIKISPEQMTGWKVKDKMKWIKDCPLPTDEVFMRLGIDKQTKTNYSKRL